jgi:hypothetical protein
LIHPYNSVEIQHRITLGTTAYYANQFALKVDSKSKSKLKLYCSIIRPTVTYVCETWVLKETTKNKLMVFERKVLTKIFGSKIERDDTWRIKTNDEIDKLIRHKNTNYIKAQRLSWFDHLQRMPEERMVKKKICKWKLMLRRPLGRPKNRWEDDIKKLKIKIFILL